MFTNDILDSLIMQAGQGRCPKGIFAGASVHSALLAQCSASSEGATTPETINQLFGLPYELSAALPPNKLLVMGECQNTKLPIVLASLTFAI